MRNNEGLDKKFSSYVDSLTQRLIDLTEDVSIDSLKAWHQKDGSTGFVATNIRGVQYKGVDSSEGLVARSSSGQMHYTTHTPGAEAGKQVLQAYYGETFVFVKGRFEGDVNHKYYIAQSGYYEVVTTKEGKRTKGEIISPHGRRHEFIGDETYVEIDDANE